MDAEGVAAVCVPSLRWRSTAARDGVHIEHEQIAKMARPRRAAVFGSAGIDPMSGMKGVKHLEQAITETASWVPRAPLRVRHPITSGEWWPFLRKCRELTAVS